MYKQRFSSSKTILGIETSCDETAAAVLEQKDGRITILSNIVASSASLQAKYGGVIPEQAAREQLKAIIPVIDEALRQAQCRPDGLDAIAVTYGPGLIGSLLVGVETAKTLALIWNKPLIPVNHLIGHFYANWISPFVIPSETRNLPSSEDPSLIVQDDNFEVPKFPCIGLLVSGGHTDLVLFENHGKYEYLGGTRDDAAGECFDKCARLLGYPYPGGPAIAQIAMKFKNQKSKIKIELPRPLLGDKTLDFSFSGLKTAVAREVDRLKKVNQWNKEITKQLSYAIQNAIVDVLVAKTIKAVQEYRVEQIMIAGGVAANQRLNEELKVKSEELKTKLHIPPVHLCTDNGAMIAAAAFFQKEIKNSLALQANPSLSL